MTDCDKTCIDETKKNKVFWEKAFESWRPEIGKYIEVNDRKGNLYKGIFIASSEYLYFSYKEFAYPYPYIEFILKGKKPNTLIVVNEVTHWRYAS